MGLLKYLGLEKEEPNKKREIQNKTNNQPKKVVPKKVTKAEAIGRSLSPLQILVLSYSPSFIIGQTDYAAFWEKKYGVENMNVILGQLEKEKLIEPGSVESAVKMASGSDLKAALKQNGLPVSGKKEVLAERLIQNVSTEILEHLFPHKPYTLTSMGKEIVNNNSHVRYIHDHPYADLDIWSMHDLMQTALKNGHDPKQYSYRDAIWGYMVKKSFDSFTEADFGEHRFIEMNMYRFLVEEKRWKTAVGHLASVLYCDLNCAEYLNFKNMDDSDLIMFKLYSVAEIAFDTKYPHIVPAAYGWIDQTMSGLNMNPEEFEKRLLLEMERISTFPMEYIGKTACVEIVMNSYRGNTSKVSEIYRKAERDYYRKYPKAKKK